MKRPPNCLPIFILVLFLLPTSAGALEREILLRPNSGTSFRLVCYAGEILEITISVTSARHVNSGEEVDDIGIDFLILQDDNVIFSQRYVRSYTWSNNVDEDTTLAVELLNPHSYCEFVIQISTMTTLIRDVILGGFLFWGIRQSQWWKYRTFTVTETIRLLSSLRRN